jgi:hypothetical protein
MYTCMENTQSKSKWDWKCKKCLQDVHDARYATYVQGWLVQRRGSEGETGGGGDKVYCQCHSGDCIEGAQEPERAWYGGLWRIPNEGEWVSGLSCIVPNRKGAKEQVCVWLVSKKIK